MAINIQISIKLFCDQNKINCYGLKPINIEQARDEDKLSETTGRRSLWEHKILGDKISGL